MKIRPGVLTEHSDGRRIINHRSLSISGVVAEVVVLSIFADGGSEPVCLRVTKHTFKSGRTLHFPGIHPVLLAANDAQIADSVVAAVTVDMIHLSVRPCARHYRNGGSVK